LEENEEITPTPYAENEEINDEVEPSEEETEANGKETETVGATDYDALAEADMKELKSLFPELHSADSIASLPNPVRYAALRDLGLSPREAYLATSEPQRRYDNRSHLTSVVPHGAGGGASVMSARELDEARALFSGLSDREIRRLYKKVTK
jgi:hypothetical protein